MSWCAFRSSVRADPLPDNLGAGTLAGEARPAGAVRARRAGTATGRLVGALSASAVALSVASVPALARAPDLPAGMPVVPLATLPKQAQDTHRLVLSGGPFPYRKDGTTFFNRERLLPRADRGYYREYTVRTPGSPDRGARRLVCGGERPTQPDACYYTADHYASFSRIAP